MRSPYSYDRKLLLLSVSLLLLVVIIGMIWWHYERELRAIEQQKKELRPD